MKRICNFILLLCLVQLAVAQNRIAEIRENLLGNHPDKILVVSHRADWRNAPENSLQGIQNCIDMGVDMVEIDLKRTKDGHLVVMHDKTINRTMSGKGLVEDYTLAELKAMRLKNGVACKTRHQIPTLEEVMLLCKGKIMVNIDKGYDYFQEAYIILEKTGTVDQCVIKAGLPYEQVKAENGAVLDKVIFMPIVQLHKKGAEAIIDSYQTHMKPAAYELVFDNDSPEVLNLIKEVRDTATAIIACGHTNFIYVALNNQVLLNKQTTSTCNEDAKEPELNLRKVYDFATTTPLDEIRFILETKRLNKAAAERSFKGNYGHELGKILKSSKSEEQILGSNTFTHILSYTSAACDARMAGAMIPVMSNSGSGNQGITATLPVVVYAEDNHKSEEELIRALTLSHLTAIYIKQSLGRLSALCGCVVAATGSSCGITYLMGGTYEQITFAVQNMIANLTGMICDGAKPSCALKLSSGVSTAVFSAILAMEHKCVSSVEGIIDNDVDRSIRNLTRIGSQGMNETDKLVLDIMTHKQCD